MSLPGEDSSSRGHLHQLLLPTGGTSTGAGVPAHPRAQLSLWSQKRPERPRDCMGQGDGSVTRWGLLGLQPSCFGAGSVAGLGTGAGRAARPPRGSPDGTRGADSDRSDCGASCAGVRYGVVCGAPKWCEYAVQLAKAMIYLACLCHKKTTMDSGQRFGSHLHLLI